VLSAPAGNAAALTPIQSAPGARYSVLVVDDDRNMRTVIRASLELAGFGVVTANDAPAALEALARDIPDLVMLDVMLPGMDGYELCRRIRRHPTCAHVPIMMLTARGETEDAVTGFEAGADDYIAKPFAPREMLARVHAKIRRVAVDSSLNPLTRLPGNLAIENEIRRRFEGRLPWAVIYLDLDNFKAFNDVYGFVRGDEAIRLVAATLQSTVRAAGEDDDFVGHIGGDDFILVTHPCRAEPLARAIATTFDRDVRGLYDPTDLERGWITTTDRRGAVSTYPVMSLSLAVVTDEPRKITNYQQIGEVAAELKRFAKKQTGSYIAMDKRKT
jgi:PleD family two-component response regulator